MTEEPGVPAEISAEISTLENEMSDRAVGEAAGGYWHSPEKQARYRELVEYQSRFNDAPAMPQDADGDRLTGEDIESLRGADEGLSDMTNFEIESVHAAINEVLAPLPNGEGVARIFDTFVTSPRVRAVAFRAIAQPLSDEEARLSKEEVWDRRAKVAVANLTQAEALQIDHFFANIDEAEEAAILDYLLTRR